MAQVTHPVSINGTALNGLTAGTRYTVENTGSKPVLLIEAETQPSSPDDKDGFWLAPRPYFPQPSRKIHQPGSRVVKPGIGMTIYAFGVKGDSTVVTNEAP